MKTITEKQLRHIISEAVNEYVQPQMENSFKEGDIARLVADLSRLSGKSGFAKGTAVRITGTWGNMVDIEELGGNTLNEVDASYLMRI